MPDLPSIYLITDRKQIPQDKHFLRVLEELLAAGVGMLQLREKDLSAAELLPLALQVRRLTNKYSCRMLINDRIDVALAVDADGVHLGGHSLPPTIARMLIGPDKLIGASTHNIDEVFAATDQGADFVTFGPVFHTPSKAAYGEPVGLEKLQQACHQKTIPIYGLGGIKPENTPDVKQAGADGIAMISGLLCADSPSSSYHQFLKNFDF
ncbi:thiamine-phosphate diphosphorylase [Malonomonas rubra DSM 5091]|uniref:Thiamine-phosphate synthase n=1 Tax=Malonomonas rubra DSM 5091 TaxID=1122189 RepID=A0A1M6BF80_MALRU|nr:thiamine phosphate synthase [Malonomonas rubra]SHI47238.1 thiamine-phosphate diphosphorylase [Malonomonas rubra DSM 5091]